MKKIAVILYGAPGSGKGTQAYLLNRSMDLMHVDAGQILEATFRDPHYAKKKSVLKQKELFDAGFLVDEKFVLGLITENVAKIARAGFGIILSGQPRRASEADVLMPMLEKFYGKKNVYFFVLNVPEEVSLKRNAQRLICKTCGMPFLSAYASSTKNRHCRVCGGVLRKRKLDNPKVIKVRLEEYKKQTKQVFEFARKRGYRVHMMDGTPAPAKVFEQIMRIIDHPIYQ